MLYDNVFAIHITMNPIVYIHNKHIKVDYHFVRERVSYGDLVVEHAPTQMQRSDIFTKSLHVS